jgi:nitroreductase
MSHPNVPLEDCPPIKRELIISREQAFQFLRARRSIRVYKDTPVDRETVQKLIELACHAPTGGNFQLVSWIAIADSDKIRKISESTIEWMRSKLEESPYRFRYPPEFLKTNISYWEKGEDLVLRNAPTLVIAMAPEMAATDPILALSYFELAATAMGLGTCWAGQLKTALLENQALRDMIQLTDDKSIFYYPMMLGYPKYEYRLLPKRKSSKIKWV